MTQEEILKEIEYWLSCGKWQATSGPYSWKNNRCIHGQAGYEGCESCMEASLSSLLTSIKERMAK